MQEKPKPEDKSDSWAEDQKDRGYYYDDAHGYEKFDPEQEESDEDAETRRRGDTEAGIPE